MIINKDNITIRSMKKEDLVFVNNTRNIFSTRAWLENSNYITLEDTINWFDNKKPNWFIIEYNKTKIGYIRTSDKTNKSICIGCDIHPDFRRKGYAKKSYKIFIKHLYEKGYVNIWLDVFKDNIAAMNLYKQLGFTSIGSRNINQKEYITMVHTKRLSIDA